MCGDFAVENGSKKLRQMSCNKFISTGAERLGWELDELLEKTILAMRSCEESVNSEMEQLY